MRSEHFVGFPSAADLRKYRLRAKLTQAQLAAKAGCHVSAVHYWEHAPGRVDGVMPGRFRRILDDLGVYVPVLSIARTPHIWPPSQKMTSPAATLPERAPGPCGAKTRAGGQCRCKPVPGKKRCKLHGGMSTGPKTPEGRARIADAQRARHRDHHLG